MVTRIICYRLRQRGACLLISRQLIHDDVNDGDKAMMKWARPALLNAAAKTASGTEYSLCGIARFRARYGTSSATMINFTRH